MIQITVQLEEITCSHEGCGITFAVPARFLRKRRDDHTTWYCPNGHARVFPAKSDLELEHEKLQRERAAHDQTKAALRDAAILLENQAVAASRLRKRVGKGVCPCCHRTVKQLAAHMASKHPKYATS